MNLPQIGCELGLLVATARNILVRIHDFTPRLQTSGGLALNRSARSLALFGPHLFVKADAKKLHFHFFDLVGLWCGDCREETASRIECSVGIITSEWFLVSPAIADIP